MPTIQHDAVSEVINLVTYPDSESVFEPPLSNATFTLDSSGVAGFFGGESAVRAMATVILVPTRRWLGWYNAPGSYEVARQYSGLAKSPVFEGLFAGGDNNPEKILMVDGRVGPEYIPVHSPTAAPSRIGHLGFLLARKVAQMPITKVFEPRRRRTKNVRVTFVRLNRAPGEFDKLDLIPSSSIVFAISTIIISVGGCIACALVGDWFCLASIALGVIANGVACAVIGSEKLFLKHNPPAQVHNPGDIVLRTDMEIIVLIGSEGAVSPFVRASFVLQFDRKPKFPLERVPLGDTAHYQGGQAATTMSCAQCQQPIVTCAACQSVRSTLPSTYPVPVSQPAPIQQPIPSQPTPSQPIPQDTSSHLDTPSPQTATPAPQIATPAPQPATPTPQPAAPALPLATPQPVTPAPPLATPQLVAPARQLAFASTIPYYPIPAPDPNLQNSQMRRGISQNHLINASVVLLLTQFLAQLLLIPQGTLFGQLMFIATLLPSWMYHSYLSSLSLDLQTQTLFQKLSILETQDIHRYQLNTWTEAVVFACVALTWMRSASSPSQKMKTENLRALLDGLLPSKIDVWQAFKESLARKLSGSNWSYVADNRLFDFTSPEDACLTDGEWSSKRILGEDLRQLRMYQGDAVSALEAWQKIRDSAEIQQLK